MIDCCKNTPNFKVYNMVSVKAYRTGKLLNRGVFINCSNKYSNIKNFFILIYECQ